MKKKRSKGAKSPPVTSWVTLAEVLGCHVRSLRNWSKMDGAPKANSGGQHSVPKWRKFIQDKGLVTKLGPETEEKRTKEELQVAQLERKNALLDIDIAERKGEVIPVEDIASRLQEVAQSQMAALRQKLEIEFPARFLELLPADSLTAEQCETLTADVRSRMKLTVDEVCALMQPLVESWEGSK